MASKEEIKQLAEDDLEAFIRLVYPKQVLGNIHSEVLRWMERSERKSHQLILLPRDHQKSRLIAFRAAWRITKDPTLRILLISSTANLAEKQLKFIKDILTSSIYTRFWPDMVNKDEGKREKWTTTEMSVDHPKRKEEGVRDPTIFTGGLTTNLVGMHCDIAILDDTVTDDTAYTNEGREKLLRQYSLLASIEGTSSEEWVVGTRYHPKDLYGDLITMEEDTYNDKGEEIGAEPVYEVLQREVEDSPGKDGTGQFLWPRQTRSDGKKFGFDQKELARKRAKYLDKSQFFAQYYNDPNDISDAPIDRSLFQYYEKRFITRENSKWFYKDRKLNVFAAIDFAFSRATKADYTALVVIGIDSNSNVYVLDISRIKTDRIADYYTLILDKHIYWDFRKLRVETNAAQKAIVKELKFSYLLPNGIALALDEHSPSFKEGSKEERMSNILDARYENRAIWHYQGGECQNLEEELVLKKPPHDDIKDALASAIEIAIPPMSSHSGKTKVGNIVFNARFGGVSI